MFTVGKQHFKTCLYVLNRFRGLTQNVTNPKWPPLGHIFGTKHGKNINETSFCMFSGTRNPLRSLFNPQYA